jgi:hypothetical protein
MRSSLIVQVLTLLLLSSCRGLAQDIILTGVPGAEYKIVVPADASKLEQRSATVLQDYIQRVSGFKPEVIVESRTMPRVKAIYVGHTSKTEDLAKLPAEAYQIKTIGKDIVIRAGSGRGIMYGVYTFLENYLGCKKISNDQVVVPEHKKITIPGSIALDGKPPFNYREVYYPASLDAEYLEWNMLQRFEDLWGLWGHSFSKLVPPQTYFSTHPEYYALVKGKRQPTQLCLSDRAVSAVVVEELRKRMAANPDAIYWSISPNDDMGYCECELCTTTNDEEGSQAGTLIRFVNHVARYFPDKQFTTLAYGYTHRAPKTMKPSENVHILLSTIDAYRDMPLTTEGSAATFRNDLKAWAALTPNLFVWDYITQFTNYLAPFPNFHTLQPNMQYLKENGIKGMFVQGSGDTYGEWAELRSYITAKLLQNDKADVRQLMTSFMDEYYGPAGKHLLQYIDLLQEKMIASKRKLDIYGNPVNEWNSYLTTELLDQYSQLIDKAEGAVEGNSKLQERVMRVRLTLDYTVLQQARFYGIEKFGIFEKDGNGNWVVREKIKAMVNRFVANCKKAGVKELSEGGPTPNEYLAEWNAIYKAGVTSTIALEGTVTLQHPFVTEYPAKGNRTLIDGNPGYNDFSYNWLCFYGEPMVATIDLGSSKKVSSVKMHFLDDPRHWIFLPENVTIEVSADGTNFKPIATINTPLADEHYENTIREFSAKNKSSASVRFIRVSATNLSALPSWRYRENKKPMIACDEIYVQ